MVALQEMELALSSSALRDDGGTHKWRKIRKRILDRDGHTCQMCGQEATHVDHIIPRRLMAGEAVDNDSNLQSLCKTCNLRKGGRFFERQATPMTPHDVFTPTNNTITHYQA